MPSKSPEQRKLMRAVAHNPEFARKAGIPQSVGEKYMKADKMKGKKYRKGGKVDGCAKRGKTKGKMVRMK